MRILAPGVYTPERDSGVHAIVGAPTSIALFVGPAATGIDLKPQRIASFTDFERLYGGLSQSSYSSYSVLHFFGNGGREAFFIRVPPAGSKPAIGGYAVNGGGARALTLEALSSGAGSSNLLVEFDSFGFALDLGAATSPVDFNLTLTDRVSGSSERFAGLTTLAGGTRVADRVLNDPDGGSNFVKLALDGAGNPAPAATGTVVKLPDIAHPGAIFAADSRASLQVDVLDASGSFQAASGFTLKDVIIFRAGEKRPLSRTELLVRTVTALNAAIIADAASATPVGALAKMNGLKIDATLHDGGAYARLRVSAPGPGSYDRRIWDAAIRLVEPDPAPGTSETSWLADFTAVNFGQKVAPSRYQLGAAYPAEFTEGTQQAGIDGDASGQPSEGAFLSAVQSLGARDPFFNTLCLAELARPRSDDPKAPFYGNVASVYAAAAKVCERKLAFLVVDAPPDVINAPNAQAGTSAALAWKSLKFPFQSSHAGAWFPNIRVDDPLVHGAIRSHPPSGAIAGVMARIDGGTGVWHAPAGTGAALNGVYGPSLVLSNDQDGLLNAAGVNCIRQFPVFGTVGFGSRTTAGADAVASDWKYIPVRRTGDHILRSLSAGLRWAVYQPNDETLWSQLRTSVTAFLQGLFRQGAFKGASARDAYFVRCDGTTTTQADINRGIVNIVIGFAPLKPAEFVVISLGQIAQPAAGGG